MSTHHDKNDSYSHPDPTEDLGQPTPDGDKNADSEHATSEWQNSQIDEQAASAERHAASRPKVDRPEVGSISTTLAPQSDEGSDGGVQDDITIDHVKAIDTAQHRQERKGETEHTAPAQTVDFDASSGIPDDAEHTSAWVEEDASPGIPNDTEHTSAWIEKPSNNTGNNAQFGEDWTGQSASGQTADARKEGSKSGNQLSLPERYALKALHAKGGMGEVWVTEDAAIGRTVALKRMLKGRERHRETFVLEAQITGQLEHPGIIPVHDLGTDDEGKPFYVMKFVRGRTLKDEIEDYHANTKKNGEPKEVQRLGLLQSFVDLCQTIAYAHSRKVIHRDIKPDNVMVGPYGETLVLDWGIAKVLGEPEVEHAELGSVVISGDYFGTALGTIKGTPYYMSPEVAEGRIDEVDEKSDIYLLGGTLYYILTGKKPRYSKNINDLVRLAKSQQPPAPRSLDKTIEKPLDAICNKALAMKKEDRYETALDLAQDVQRFLAGEPVTAYQETFLEKTVRWCRKHRTLLARAVAACVLIGLIVFGYVKWRELEHQWALERQESRAKLKKAEAAAAKLERQKEAQNELNRYYRLADEMRYFAANSDPVSEQTPFFDLRKGLAKGREALAIAEKWGPTLDRMPLADKRDPLAKDLYELILLTVQIQGRQAEQEQSASLRLALLDRAAKLHPPTRSFYRLRAELFEELGEPDKAAAAKKLASDEDMPLTQLDHFLEGERHRVKSTGHASAKDDEKTEAVLKSHFHKAIAEYRKATGLDPKHFWSHFQLGRCYLGLGENAQAVECLGACIAVRPESPWGYSVRGLALALLDRYDEAKADLDKAIALDENFLPPRLNRGVVYMLEEDYKRALEDLTVVLEAPLDKQLIEAAFYRGKILLEQGEFKKALEDFNRVIEAKRHIRLLYKLRARALFSLGEWADGLDSLLLFSTDGKPLDPTSAEAHARKGHQLRLLAFDLPKEESAAILQLAGSELATAFKKDYRDVEFLDDLGAVLEALGDTKQAILAYSLALKEDEENLKVLLQRGWALEKLQPPQYEQAATDFAGALRLFPNHPEAHTGLGYISACMNEAGAAKRHAHNAVLYGGDKYLILYNVACIHAKLSVTDKEHSTEYQNMTIDLLRRAIELWRRERKGPNPIDLIKGDPAFPPDLWQRPEFKQLLKPLDA